MCHGLAFDPVFALCCVPLRCSSLNAVCERSARDTDAARVESCEHHAVFRQVRVAPPLRVSGALFAAVSLTNRMALLILTATWSQTRWARV
jgi:hypothetical protein